jgi:hypothetical protein
MKNILKMTTLLSLMIFSHKALGQATTVTAVMGTIPACNGEKKIEINKKYSLQSKEQLDTLNYLKQLEANKKDYIDRPFSKVLNDMKFAKPQKMWVTPIHGIRKLVSITIFCFNERCPFNPDNAGCLSVTWEEPIYYRGDYYSLEIKNNNSFTQDEKAFFSSKIIKDIQVYKR